MAVFTLPPEMIGFFKQHIEFVTEHAVDPDKRRYAVDGEAPRHYIDIDHYCESVCFDVMPRKWYDAVEMYTEDTLKAYGTVPWAISLMKFKLTKAFEDHNFTLILKYASEIGHYIGDSHVPLHTTENYNGAETNQKGIHGFWESRLPELYAEDYDYFVGKAKYVDNVLDMAWNTVEVSHAAKDSVLLFEADLNGKFPVDQKYSYELRGKKTVKAYSMEYSLEYRNMLGGMVERRLRKSIITVGSVWYTAWVDAGQPDLSEIKAELDESYVKEQEENSRSYNLNKIKGRAH